MFKLTLILLIAVFGQSFGQKTGRITFYEGEFYQGQSVEVTPTADCANLTAEWWDRVSSINTHGNCIEVFDFQDCRTSNQAVHPSLVFNIAQTTPENIPHPSFVGSWFDNQARSYKACSSSTGGGSSGGGQVDATQTRLLALVNQARGQRGLGPLTYNPRLARAAQLHSEDMARTGRLSHKGSDGSSASERVSRQGYQWSSVAENVAQGQQSADEVFNSWMNSSGHKANILRANSVEYGGGRANAFWTQVFAAPLQGKRGAE